MTTQTKKRINLSVSPDIDKTLARLAERDQVPVATKALELIKKALQTEEDVVLDFLAQRRDKKGARYLPHRKVWSQLTR